jgi:hypothetical protein
MYRQKEKSRKAETGSTPKCHGSLTLMTFQCKNNKHNLFLILIQKTLLSLGRWAAKLMARPALYDSYHSSNPDNSQKNTK